MRRKLWFLALLAAICLFAGCASKEQSAPKYVRAEITGSFSATVREVIPDYCLDDFTPQVAVVTLFQDGPFTVYLGEELASQVEVGEQYVFTVNTEEIGEIPEEQLEEYINPVLLDAYGISIESVRLAKEDEWGLESPTLSYNILE